MFTGLIECVGTVISVMPDRTAPGVLAIRISAPEISDELRVGDSISVSGVCLTATEVVSGGFCAQMMRETARATRLKALSAGARVNIERALQVGSRLDGHIVQGHVDAVGRVISIEPVGGGGSIELHIASPMEIAWGIAPKGSISIDGVSLTVIDSSDTSFSVGIIPETFKRTALSYLRASDSVNIEIDVIARYVANMLRSQRDDSGITEEKLIQYGWL